MDSLPKAYYTPEEYLALERAVEYKSEYLDGLILAMAGISRSHNTITLNIAGELCAPFRGGSCRVHAVDIRVKVEATRSSETP